MIECTGKPNGYLITKKEYGDYKLEVGSTQHLPPCPECANGNWNTQSGGDSVEDPYPDR